MRGQASKKPPEEGIEGRGLGGKKSRGGGGGSSEREHSNRAEIPNGTQRPPQAPQARKPPFPNRGARSESPPPPAPLRGTFRAQQARIRQIEANEGPWEEQRSAHHQYFASAPDLLHTKCRYNEKKCRQAGKKKLKVES